MRDQDLDAGLLTGAGAADRFTAVFDEHSAGLWRFLARQVDSGHAEDLVAETFLTAWSARGDCRAERGSLRAWLYGIAVNLLRRHHRTHQQQDRMAYRLSAQHPPADNEEDRIAERLDARARLEVLAAAIIALSDGDRDVLLLGSLAELDTREIAVALGIPEGTVRSRLHRVRRTLRAAASHTAAPTQGKS